MQEIKTLGQLKGAERIKNLPIYSHLEEICRALKASPSRFLILTAETGAGKSTAVPLALLEAFQKKILMLQPRRLAAVNVASRVAELLGERVGQTAGYKVFLENKTSESTRLEVMTEAILTRRLQADPSLEDVSVVVLDEFHERSINADLALAFLKEAMQLRDDLFVIIMSATIDARRIARFCGTVGATETESKTGNTAQTANGDKAKNAGQSEADSKTITPAPVLEIPGRTFPVQFFYKPELSVSAAVRWALSRFATDADGKTKTAGDTEIACKTKTAGATKTCSTPKTAGRSILVFLPGIYEINKTFSELSGEISHAVQIERLHSSVSFDEQKKILSPAEPGVTRVILSSSIAETSLTIPDVVCVIDSGLSRVSVMDNNVGATRLVTMPESEFSAAQRAGRAGRTQEGVCVRLWSQNEPRSKNPLPEILRSDLSELLLECAEWGSQDPAALEWLDPPAPSSWETARELLRLLNCLDNDGQITQLGRAALRLGIGPRLGCAAIYGGAAFVLQYSQYKDSAPALQKKFVLNLERRLEEAGAQIAGLQKGAEFSPPPDPLLAGFPDRLAHRTADAGVYQFPSGRLAALKDYKGGLGPEWIVAVEADAGSSQGAIYSYKALDSVQLEEWILSRVQKKVVCDFENGKVVKTEFTQYGKIILSQKALKAGDEDIKSALCFSVQKNGFDSLPLDEKTKAFLVKRKFYEQASAAGGGNLSLANDSSSAAGSLGQGTVPPKRFDKNWLSQNAAEWLAPFLTGNKISAQNVYDALYYFYNGSEVEKNVPSKLELQTGRAVKVVYVDGEKVVPTIEIIIQQIFGCFETPKVMGVPVLLKLLSPARRPLQITSDLENFWQNTWPEICKEMKGRYPKHNWDYRVAEKG
ncbi:MAG: ATP-dependent helicase C-terminal domain-containing protein [Treponema sp.]|nr:ATP-dependent helicase C-terminal domain-containing protein [Treponema sp.]MEE3436169.1 ATP-dependent helicase C-terminal domain-containing protein [Treponema sp.]